MTRATEATNPTARSAGIRLETRARSGTFSTMASALSTKLRGARGLQIPHARGAPFTPPRLQDHARVAEAVQRVVALLALARRALVHDDRALGDPVALVDRADEELGGLVLDLLLADRRRHLRAHRAEPARRVGDRHAGEEPHEPG